MLSQPTGPINNVKVKNIVLIGYARWVVLKIVMKRQCCFYVANPRSKIIFFNKNQAGKHDGGLRITIVFPLKSPVTSCLPFIQHRRT